jgi:Putative lipoprotein LpqV
MRSYPLCAVAVAAIMAMSGCSSEGEGGPSSATPATTSTSSSETHAAAPGATEVAPGGATTAIGADAESTEEEYSQACRAAKAWIDQQGGDRQSQVEPFLKQIQDPNTPPGPATYNTPWAQLSAARQAAVIVAVQAGADSLC